MEFDEGHKQSEDTLPDKTNFREPKAHKCEQTWMFHAGPTVFVEKGSEIQNLVCDRTSSDSGVWAHEIETIQEILILFLRNEAELYENLEH